jgi:hypothetical protein
MHQNGQLRDSRKTAAISIKAHITTRGLEIEPISKCTEVIGAQKCWRRVVTLTGISESQAK